VTNTNPAEATIDKSATAPVGGLLGGNGQGDKTLKVAGNHGK